MKQLISSIALVFFCFSCIGLCQDLPDYPERLLSDKVDTMGVEVPDFAVVGATEGAINPEEYIVGPGDKLFISISGVKEMVHTLIMSLK